MSFGCCYGIFKCFLTNVDDNPGQVVKRPLSIALVNVDITGEKQAACRNFASSACVVYFLRMTFIFGLLKCTVVSDNISCFCCFLRILLVCLNFLEVNTFFLGIGCCVIGSCICGKLDLFLYILGCILGNLKSSSFNLCLKIDVSE